MRRRRSAGGVERLHSMFIPKGTKSEHTDDSQLTANFRATPCLSVVFVRVHDAQGFLVYAAPEEMTAHRS